MRDKDLKTCGIVLKRVNYGEADRILTLITPNGKISAMAKGVRRPKSKLAGGVEIFSLSDLNLHVGKSDLYTITSARMVKYFGNILKDFERMELAGEILKRINRESEVETAEYFEITKECLEELNSGLDIKIVKAWFLLNITNVAEEINLHRDVSGQKLEAEKKYNWNIAERAFEEKENGRFAADEIKLLRLMVKMKLSEIKRIKVDETIFSKILEFAEMMI